MKKVLIILCCIHGFSAVAQNDSLKTPGAVADSLRVVGLSDDLLYYNTKYFRLNPGARLIDLLRKMPAVLSTDNTWIARGDKVMGFSVNDKELFINNDNAVIYNMPAASVKRVNFSEDANTQINDNNYCKTVNFVVDSTYFNRLFGRAYLGGGLESSWNAGINVNLYQGTRHLTVTAGSNNVNYNNFTPIDLTGVRGSSGIQDYGAADNVHDALNSFANNLSIFLFDPTIGINTANYIGISYADRSGDLFGYRGNYFFNATNNATTGSIHRQYIGGDNNITVYDENSHSSSSMRNHRLNISATYYFDTYTSLRLTAGLTTQATEGNNTVESSISTATDQLVHSTDISTVERSGLNSWVDLFFITKAKTKPGRSFSARITPDINRQSGETQLEGTVELLPPSPRSANHLSLESHYRKNDYTVPVRFIYVEPLAGHSKLIIDYSPKIIYGQSGKQVDNFVFNRPNLFISDSLMSNDFTSLYRQQCLGVSMAYNKDKWDITAGLYAQYAAIHNKDNRETALNNTERLFSVFPMLNLLYKHSERQNLRVHLKSFTQKPSLTQMEHLVRMLNPLNLKIGNPYLKMEWHNKLDARYTIVGSDYSTSWLFYASAEHVNNYIGSHRINITDSGSSITVNSIIQPVNFDHSFTAALYAAYTKHVAPLRSNIDIAAQYGYSHIPGMVDDIKTITRHNSVALNLRLSSGISEAIDFIVSSTGAYNFVRYSIHKSASNVFQQSSYALINVIFPKGFLLSSDLTHNFNWYKTLSAGQHVVLWNVSAGYKFLAKQAAEIRFTVHDIFDNNKNIYHVMADTYTERINTNNIRRYFMLLLLYNL